jgi:soluble lytic murein transglycosylase-like protein
VDTGTAAVFEHGMDISDPGKRCRSPYISPGRFRGSRAPDRGPGFHSDCCRSPDDGGRQPPGRDPGRKSGRPSLYLRLPAYAVTVAFLISFVPTTTSTVVSGGTEAGTVTAPAVEQEVTAVSDPAVNDIEDVLGRHLRVTTARRPRIARTAVTSARKHDVGPFLVASILLVESRGDPFSISTRDAVGIMQIHVPTGGSLAEAERINLFRLEDNIDLGTRVLRDYTRRHGLSAGVLRYVGATGPGEEATSYVQRVQGIYSDRLAD